jgi:HSF-type DNA-binding
MLILNYLETLSTSSGAQIPSLQWYRSSDKEVNDSILVVNDPSRFILDVLPEFSFPPTSFKSFVRKMHRWGFHRADVPGRWAFVCDQFRRGNFILLSQMVSVDS